MTEVITFHDIARVLEHESMVSGDEVEAGLLARAALLMRRRGDVAANIEALEQARRLGRPGRG